MRDRHLQLLAALTIGGAAIRLATLDLQSFHHDEAVTAARVIQPGLVETLEMVRDSERSGPVYYLLAWLWSKPFGTGEAGLRSLSALFGVLTIPVAYLAAAELVSRRAGVVAAALVAVNPYLVWYSQEARSYGLLVLLGALGLLFFARSLRTGGTRELALWAVSSAVALATHYFAVFLLAPQAAWLAIVLRGRRALAAVGGVAAAGLVLLPLAVRQSENGSRNLFAESASLPERVMQLGVKFAGGEEMDPCTPLAGVGCAGLGLGLIAAGLGAAGLLILVLRADPAGRRGGLIAAAVGGLGLLLPLALAVGGADLFNPKNLVGALVPLLIAAAAGFAAPRSARLGAAAAAAMVTAFGVGTAAVMATPALQRPDWRGLAQAIGDAQEPRLIVAPLKADDPLLLYAGDLEKVRSRVEEVGHDRTRSRRASVRELVVVTDAPDIPRPAPGVELVERGAGAQYDLYRYAVSDRRPVDVSRLDGRRLVGPRFVVLLDRGSGPGDGGAAARDRTLPPRAQSGGGSGVTAATAARRSRPCSGAPRPAASRPGGWRV